MTELGMMLYRESNRILNIWDDIQLQAADINNSIEHSIKIGITASYGRAFLPRVYSEITNRYPEMKITFVVCKSNDLENQLLNGEIDAAILWGLHPHPLLNSEVLFHQRMMLVMRGDDALNQYGYRDEETGMDYMDLPKLGEKPLLSYSMETPHLNAIVSAICHENKWEPQITSRFVQSSIILSMVSAGIGIGIIPWDSIQGGNLMPVDNGINSYNIKGNNAQCFYSFAYRMDKHIPKTVRLFLSACKDVHSKLLEENVDLKFFDDCTHSGHKNTVSFIDSERKKGDNEE